MASFTSFRSAGRVVNYQLSWPIFFLNYFEASSVPQAAFHVQAQDTLGLSYFLASQEAFMQSCQ